MTSVKDSCPSTNGNGFYTLDKSQNICVHPAVKCSLGGKTIYDQNGTALQPCYNDDGSTNKNALPRPSDSTGIKATPATVVKPKVPTLADQCAALMPFGGDSKGRPKIISDIEALQKTEKDLLSKMQAQVGSDGKVKNKGIIKDLMNQLKPIQDARIRLLQQLNYVASTSQCSLSGDRRALQDQLSMVLIAEDQLKNIESKTEELINARDSKHRLVQITNYEYHRYRSHASIFRTIAFCSLFILGGVYLNKLGMSMIGNAIIVLSIAVCAVLIVGRIYDNYSRSPMNWNQFEWVLNNDHGNRVPTVLEVDEKFFENSYGFAKKEAGAAYNQADDYLNKAESDAKKAYGDVKKNVDKDVNKATSAMGKVKGSQASEGFAPFN
jgi:hypothetical protein